MGSEPTSGASFTRFLPPALRGIAPIEVFPVLASFLIVVGTMKGLVFKGELFSLLDN